MNRVVLNCKRVWRLKKHVWLLTALQNNGPTIEELFVDMFMSYSTLVELTLEYIDQRNTLKVAGWMQKSLANGEITGSAASAEKLLADETRLRNCVQLLSQNERHRWPSWKKVLTPNILHCTSDLIRLMNVHTCTHIFTKLLSLAQNTG